MCSFQLVGGISDLWIFDIKNKSWKKLFNIPKNFTYRSYHSLSLWSVTPTTNWIIVFGGTTSYRDTAVIELILEGTKVSGLFIKTYISDWSTSVIPLDQYQEKLQERRREWEGEIDRLTRVLQEREREQEEERREKEQVRNRLQQQLEGRERQLEQAQQQGQERERQAREQEQNLQQRLHEQEQQFQESQRQLQREIQQGGEREQGLQQQLQEAQQQLQESQQQGQERERQVQDLQRQLQEREQQLVEREREFQERERQLEEQIQVAESSWVVNRREITMTEVVLGKGGWGEVKVAGFRGLKVAAKCLYEIIISPHNITKFFREMN
ncbi:PREDICTED: putative uncharacterized protein DDB_G0271606, partial [Amphimedon queenslandica]|uniref:Protein kinase domain-containing protein n=1 Tax=Amphimedon queenslandica TaxID=400682 RepID=A0AAN0JVD5_AMPQE